MAVIFLTLWTLSVFLLLKYSRSSAMRWAAATAFIGGSGAFGRALIETFIPYLKTYSLIEPHIELLTQWIYVLCTLANNLFMPYLFLIFCIAYTEKIRTGLTKLILLIPPVATLVYTVLSNPVFPKPIYNYAIIDVWVAPYIIFGFYLLLTAIKSEINPLKKQSRATSLIVCSPVLFQLFSVYVLRLLGYQEAFRFNIIFFAVIFPFIIYFLINYDIFGIRLRLEKRQFAYTMKIMTSGTTILNHAIKNQLYTASLCSTNIRKDYLKSQKIVPFELDILDSSLNHMLQMVEKIQEQTQEIIIEKVHSILNDLISDTLILLNESVARKDISVKVSCPPETSIACDNTHFKEVMHNILKNSIEAIEDNGIIEISVQESKRFVSVIVKDNGKGISENDLEHIFEPFYSTKKLKSNFGLGLTYCYQVMEKHKGSISINSKSNQGTTVVLNFPLLQRV